MRARDFIFEAVSRRGFLKGLGAAAAVSKAGITTAPITKPKAKIDNETITKLFIRARDWLYKRDSDDPQDATLEPTGLKGLLPNYNHYSIRETSKGNPYLFWNNESGYGVSYIKNNKTYILYSDFELNRVYIYPKDDKIALKNVYELPLSAWDENYKHIQFDKIEKCIDATIENILIYNEPEMKLDVIHYPTQTFSQYQAISIRNLFSKFIHNTTQSLAQDTVKHIIDGMFNAAQISTSDNVIDVEPTDVTVHEPMQALPAPQQALPPPSLSDIEANFVEALGRYLTDQERVLIQQEYNKKKSLTSESDDGLPRLPSRSELEKRKLAHIVKTRTPEQVIKTLKPDAIEILNDLSDLLDRWDEENNKYYEIADLVASTLKMQGDYMGTPAGHKLIDVVWRFRDDPDRGAKQLIKLILASGIQISTLKNAIIELMNDEYFINPNVD